MLAGNENEPAAGYKALGGLDVGYDGIRLVGERIGQIVCRVVNHQCEPRDSHGRGEQIWRRDTGDLVARDIVADVCS